MQGRNGFGALIRAERDAIPWSMPTAAAELETVLGERVSVKRWRCLEAREEIPPKDLFLAVCDLFDWKPLSVLVQLGYVPEGEDPRIDAGDAGEFAIL